jgi:serine protease Do
MEARARPGESIASAESAIAAAARSVGPAVVGIGRGWGFGSGVVVGPGRIVTSAHNVRGREAPVTFRDGRRAAAAVQGSDPDRDVAVLSADTAGVEPVAWEPRAEDDLGIGTAVIALADPGGRGLRATLGFISAARRRFRGLRGRRLEVGIEHTAPLPRGSSGGPLVDVHGRLIGFNTLRLEGGLVLAVAADGQLRDRCERIGRGEVAPPRRLGVALAPAGVTRRMRRAVGLPEREGLLVRAVEEASPAARAGVLAGDLIVRVGDRAVDGLDPLHSALDALGPDGELALGVVRGAEELEISVAFGDAAAEGEQ